MILCATVCGVNSCVHWWVRVCVCVCICNAISWLHYVGMGKYQVRITGNSLWVVNAHVLCLLFMDDKILTFVNLIKIEASFSNVTFSLWINQKWKTKAKSSVIWSLLLYCSQNTTAFFWRKLLSHTCLHPHFHPHSLTHNSNNNSDIDSLLLSLR